jgi:acyl carrier protein
MDYVDIGNLTGEVSKNTDATLPLEVRAAISVVPQRESIETKPDCAANKSGIEATIKRELTRIMEFREGDEIDVDRPLVDMGMDSLMSLELRKSLSKHFNVSLPSTLIFEYPTIQKLSLHLASLVTKDVPVEVKSASTVSEKLDGRDAGPSNVPEPTTIEPAPSKVSPDVLSFLRNEAARIMEFENGEAIDPERPLVDMGFDSLMSVELRKAIAVKFSIKVPTTLVFEYPTLSKIAGYLASQVNVAA